MNNPVTNTIVGNCIIPRYDPNVSESHFAHIGMSWPLPNRNTKVLPESSHITNTRAIMNILEVRENLLMGVSSNNRITMNIAGRSKVGENLKSIRAYNKYIKKGKANPNNAMFKPKDFKDQAYRMATKSRIVIQMGLKLSGKLKPVLDIK